MTSVTVYSGCTNVNRVEVNMGADPFDFSAFERITLFVRSETDFGVTTVDSVGNPGSIVVASPGVLDLTLGDILTIAGSYQAGLKVFTLAADTSGQMIFHDQERKLLFRVLPGVPPA